MTPPAAHAPPPATPPATPLSARRRPRPLSRGARLALIAPAGPMDAGRLDAALAPYRAAGFEVVARRALDAAPPPAPPYLAGDDATRLDELWWALTDPSIDGVLCARGGYGSMRLLPGLRARLASAGRALAPRPLIGFSDITALHAACFTLLGWQSIHAPMVINFAPASSARRANHEQRRSWESLYAALTDDDPGAGLACAPQPGRPPVEGVLFGGNLSLIAALYRTPYLPSLAGVILLLEDVDEAPYRLDRLVTSLWLAGAAEEVAGVALGAFTPCGALSAQDACAHVARCFEGWGVPVARGVEVGHIDSQRAVWLGQRCLLDLEAGVVRPLGAADEDAPASSPPPAVSRA